MKKFRFQKGMTLVEVLVAMGIFVAVMFTVAVFQYNVITYPKNISDSFTTTQDTQILLRTMLRELRTMEPSANGSYSISTTGTSSITFYSDSKNDGIVEQISYYLASSSIYRSSIDPSGTPPTYNGANRVTKTIVNNVRNSSSTPLFEYFDTNYTGTSSPLSQPVTATAVRLIKINLLLDVDVNRSPTPILYVVEASLRNLKTNL